MPPPRLTLLHSMNNARFEARMTALKTYKQFREMLDIDSEVQQLLLYLQDDLEFADNVFQFFQEKFRTRSAGDLTHPHDKLIAALLYVLWKAGQPDLERWAIRIMDDPIMDWAGDVAQEIVVKGE